MKTCKNCGNTNDGKYCSDCGQSLDTHEINFHFLVHEIQHSIFHVDKGILYTIKELCYRPGHAIREYIDGKRVRYFKPIMFVVILSTIYSLLEYSIERRPIAEDFLSGAMDGAFEKDADGQGSLIIGFLEWMLSHYAYTVLFMIPLISLASYLAYIRQKHNYFHHLVLNVYIAGQITFFYIILFLPVNFVLGQYVETFDIIKLIIGLAYAGWVYFQFFIDKSVISKIWCTFFTFILFLIIATSLTFVLMILSEIF